MSATPHPSVRVSVIKASEKNVFSGCTVDSLFVPMYLGVSLRYFDLVTHNFITHNCIEQLYRYFSFLFHFAFIFFHYDYCKLFVSLFVATR